MSAEIRVGLPPAIPVSLAHPATKESYPTAAVAFRKFLTGTTAGAVFCCSRSSARCAADQNWRSPSSALEFEQVLLVEWPAFATADHQTALHFRRIDHRQVDRHVDVGPGEPDRRTSILLPIAPGTPGHRRGVASR